MNIGRRQYLSLGMSVVASSPFCGGAFAAPLNGDGDKEGVKWITLSSKHKVWTKRVGNGRTKVLLLHGGPGLSHDYMSCFADFLPGAGYEIYFYDQLGCGLSERPDDSSLWTLARYIKEVEEVRIGLGLDQFVLIGHSWGSLLAMEYALQYQQHLQSLVLSNMTASAADYNSYNNKLKHRLPAPLLNRIIAMQKSGDVNSPEYADIVMSHYFSLYCGRLKPWPVGLIHSFSVMNQSIDDEIFGPDQYVIAGSLARWDRWDDLHRIKTPALAMGAKYDFMDPRSIEREAKLLPKGQVFLSKTGSHLAMWDDQQNYFSTLIAFLKSHQV